MSNKKAGLWPPLRALALVGLTLALAGCYHARLTAAGNALTTTGLPVILSSSRVLPPVPLPPPPTDCSANGLNQVLVETTYGHALHTVFTFGSWSQVQVKYWCAAPAPSGVPALPGTPPPAAAAPVAGPPAPLITATMNPMLWGALQDNQNENVASKKKNPANCTSQTMRQFIVPKSYGNALIAVLTLGIWAPIKVEWQCGGDGTSK